MQIIKDYDLLIICFYIDKRIYLDMPKSIFLLLALLLYQNAVKAGLDKYTYLDKIGNWTIERKVDSKSNDIFCRASIFDGGTWFGSRTRLDQNGEIVFPSHTLKRASPNKERLATVKQALEACRSGLIYFPEIFEE